jgi:hypothetical protein
MGESGTPSQGANLHAQPDRSALPSSSLQLLYSFVAADAIRGGKDDQAFAYSKRDEACARLAVFNHHALDWSHYTN